MQQFLRGFFSNSTLTNRSTIEVMLYARRKAVELAMLNQIEEAYSIFAILAPVKMDTRESGRRPLTRKTPEAMEFLFEIVETLPPGISEAEKAEGEDELQHLEQELFEGLLGPVPVLPEGINITRNATEEDFWKLDNWVKELEDSDKNGFCNATTGNDAKCLSAGLAGLLNISLYLNKAAEAEDIMSRIANRIHANLQSEFLSCIRPAWKRYFVSGWLRDRLGLVEDELKQYAEFVRDVTRKRLEEGIVNPSDEYKDKGFKEMLEELDRNTLRFPEQFEELWYESDGSDGGHVEWDGYIDERDEKGRPLNKPKYTAPTTILRKPATAAQTAEAESRIGHSLPDDVKDFYALTNGTRPVISGPYISYLLSDHFPKVEDLYWEDDSWVNDYPLDLLPGAETPVPIEWPGIEGGIAMYVNDGQGTDYLWYIKGELLAKAKKVLEDIYQNIGDAEKKILDTLVKQYHGSWEKLRALQSCWYQQPWGDPDSMVVFHDFREFLSLVVLQSRYEEDRSPLKLPEGEV